jgi:aminopeptidase N
MVRRQLGDDGFWRGIKRYSNEHRLQSVETADFRRTLERETGRDLDRFFYDWTERAGSPVLEVSTEYRAEAKQARVVIKQTQAGEAFQFPLTVAFYCPGADKPVVVEQQVTDKDSTLVVPLPGRPTRVDVDPEYTLLGEINETKSRELWEAQLLAGPNVVARIRAAKHLGQGKQETDGQLLARAFRNEKLWGTRAEIATMLGEVRGDACRDALLEGVRDQDAKVRRACVSQLAKFKSDAKAVDAIKTILKEGDPSYGVQTAALDAYAQQGHKDAVAVILPWMSKPSHRDMLRTGALAALGRTGDPAALDTLLEWSEAGHPRACRSSAFQGLAQLSRTAKTNNGQRQRIMKALSGALESDNDNIRIFVLQAVSGLGAETAELLPALEKLAREDSAETVSTQLREFAKRTAEQIKSKQGGGSTDVKQLKEELERLKREQEALRERLNNYEKGAKKN